MEKLNKEMKISTDQNDLEEDESNESDKLKDAKYSLIDKPFKLQCKIFQNEFILNNLYILNSMRLILHYPLINY